MTDFLALSCTDLVNCLAVMMAGTTLATFYKCLPNVPLCPFLWKIYVCSVNPFFVEASWLYQPRRDNGVVWETRWSDQRRSGERGIRPQMGRYTSVTWENREMRNELSVSGERGQVRRDQFLVSAETRQHSQLREDSELKSLLGWGCPSVSKSVV